MTDPPFPRSLPQANDRPTDNLADDRSADDLAVVISLLQNALQLAKRHGLGKF